MAPHEEEDDPAVYRSGSSKKKTNGAAPNGSHTNGKSHGHNSSPNGKHPPRSSPAAIDSDAEADEAEEDDEDDDGTLLTVQPGFNRLLLVLRDERVMRFVKYVSAAAEGSRWDVCGEYEVGMVEEDGEE